MKKKVLYLLGHAPHYREPFLELLGAEYDLTVCAYNCADANLTPPKSRNGYNYIELKKKRSFGKLDIYIDRKEIKTLKNEKWDVVMCGWNLHHPFRYINFIKNVFQRKYKWIWVGLFYGKSENTVIRLLRKHLLSLSNGVLTYTQEVKDKLIRDGVQGTIEPFNNTNIKQREFRNFVFDDKSATLNIIYIGRYQARKKIERLIALAERNNNIKLRLIGPLMNELNNKYRIKKNKNIEIYGPLVEKELDIHMEWAHVVCNPGGLGLLVMIAAKYAKPIVVDKSSYHGPEIAIAKNSNQYIIDWSNINAVDEVLERFHSNNNIIKSKGMELQKYAYKNFTIEHMVNAYINVIERK